MSRKDVEIYDTKMSVFERDGWKCRYCRDGKVLQLAHRIPQTKANLKKYGARIIHDPANLETTCPECNSMALVSQNPLLEAEIVSFIRAKISGEDLADLPF